MNFSRDAFASQLGKYFTMGPSGWSPYGDGNLNQHVDYTDGGYAYRSWSPESSVMKNNLGMLLSCKLDLENTFGDDHIILLTGFMLDRNGSRKLVMVQASVQFAGKNDSGSNIMSDPITTSQSDPNRDLGQAMYDFLYTTINGLGSDYNTGARMTLPHLAKVNIDSLSAAVS